MSNSKHILKVGLVGFGEQGQVHADYLYKSRKEDVQIEAICGIRERNLEIAQNELRTLDIPVFPFYCAPSDYSPQETYFLEEMLDQHQDLDAVIISTPHAMHYYQAQFCLNAGLHVLVDKPLTTTYSHAKQLVTLARERGKTLVVANQRRYEDAYHYVGEVVHSGGLGELRASNGILSHQRGWMHGWRANSKLSGGGTIMSIGHHLIDTLIWIADEPAVEVNAYGLIEPKADVETYLEALVLFESGFAASITVNHGSPTGSVYERLQLWGTEGNITVDRFKPTYDKELPKVTHQTIEGQIIPKDFSNEPSKKWLPTRNFVNSLLYDEPLLSSGEQNLVTMQVIDAIYQSLKSKKRCVIRHY
jgi:predicted dehydrogenase